MSDQGQKPVLQSAIEGFISQGLGGMLANQMAQNPPPPLAEQGDPITPSSILAATKKSLDRGLPADAMKQCLILACWLARSQGMTMADAAKQASIAWAQTSGLTPL
jgi:hypothetical protein